jgi:F5/8 type C domain
LHLILMILILSPLGYSTNLSAFPSLKPSSIDNKYDIPIGIPIETGTTDLSINTKANLQNTTYSLESLPEELQLLESTVSTLATCEKLPVTSVTAIGNDGNIPSNVIDNNLNTRWSNLGQGSWIQLDLGSKKSICSVDIPWYRGDLRQNNFVISVSDDGTTFTNKLTDTSSLGTAAEKYTLPGGTEGRYVRITVNGNTENDWASINEISVFGGATSGGGGGGGSNVIGTLFHKLQTTAGGSTWSPYSSLSGDVAPDTDSAIAMNSDGRLQVLIVGANNQVYYKTQTAAGSSTWTGWTSLGGGIKADTSPAVARNSDGRLQVFVVGTNNQLYYKTQTAAGSSTWSSAWTSLGGGLRANTDPIVIANNDGRLQVFVVGTNNQLLYKTQSSPNSNTWSPAWTSLGGGIKADTSPAVARNNDGRLQAFVVGANNQLLYKTQSSPNGNTWSSSWTSLGGGLRDNTDPAVVPNTNGRLEAFVMGPKTSTTPPPPPPPPTNNNFPYAFVGSPQDMEDEGWGTRHYASGKPDDITHEWSGETSAQNYAIIIDITLTEIDHDDTISFKFGGTHMGSGWYDNTYSFESGEACIGKEEDHPSTDLCVVTGNSIGNLVNTPVKLAAVNIGKGEKLEMYSNKGSGWTKDVESSNGVDGFRPQVDEDEVNIRIDAAPGIVMRSAQIVEIDPASGGINTLAPATTLTPTASDKMVSTEDDGWTEGDYGGSLQEQAEQAQEDWEDAGRPGDEEDGDDVAPPSVGESRPSS